MNKIKNILIVEDDLDLRLQIKMILEDEGYAVDAVEHGQAALDYLQERGADALPFCILLDLTMPVMSGEAFLKKIAGSKRADLMAIPIIVTTAKGSSKNLKDLPVQVERVSKPMEIETLLKAIAKYR